MCVVGRKVLIHGEARKNKSLRKKYFVLNCGDNYTSPRLDYFSSIDKWSQNHRNEVYCDVVDGFSFRFIDLSKLFFVDDVHRSKPKQGGLDLYLEDSHVTLTFASDEVKNAWKELFENVVYKNGKLRAYPKIEYTFQVGLRLKPKENIDKALLKQLKGDFRACFMRTSLMFVNKTLENPDFSIEYQFIRNMESRFDGSFRLEIGRAAVIGECLLVMQLADYAESNAAHAMLIKCTKSFKLSLPEPVRTRNSMSKVPNRRSSVSSSRALSVRSSVGGGALRAVSCVPWSGDSESVIGRIQADPEDKESDEYMEMNVTSEENPTVRSYIEHLSRVYRCSECETLTTVVTFCSRCTTPSSIRLLLGLPHLVTSKFLPPIRDKTQSLTERPRLQSPSINNAGQYRQCLSELRKSSQSSLKTWTSEMSSISKLESQNSLSVSSNRHDNDIFADLYFDGATATKTSSSSQTSQSSTLKCQNCYHVLESPSQNESSSGSHCTKCNSELVSWMKAVEEPEHAVTAPHNDSWIPRTKSLIPGGRASTIRVSCTSEYVDATKHTDTKITRNTKYIDNYCS